MGLLQRYVDSLPDGPRSFPECQVRADAFDEVAECTEAEVPEAVRALRAEYLPGGRADWIPEVYANCLTLLFREEVHSSDASCLAFFHRNNDELFGKPLYRMVMLVLSPTLAVMGAEKRWSTFRKGTALSARRLRKDGPGRRAATIHLEYPPGLYHPFHLKMIATGIESAVRAAGAKDIQMPASDVSTPGHAVWDLGYG